MTKKKDDKYWLSNPQETITRSNVLIRSISSSSLFERKALTVALSRIKLEDDGIRGKSLVARINATELRTLMGLSKNSGGIYNQMKQLSQKVLKHSIFIESEEEAFVAFNIVDRVEYSERGTLTIKFNMDISPFVTNLESQYTRMSLSILSLFKSNYTYRIYELLQTKSYLLDFSPVVQVPYSLAELKFQIGVIDTDNSTIGMKLRQGKNMEQIIEETPTNLKHYDSWRDFKRRVLDVAKKEMEESEFCDIIFDYEVVKSGRGGKISQVIFFIRKNPKFQPENIPSFMDYLKGDSKEKYHQLTLFDDNSKIIDYVDIKEQEVMKLLNEEISHEDAQVLLDAAGDDLDKIRRAYEYSHSQDVKNLIPWMKTAIEKGWAEKKPVKKPAKKTSKATTDAEHMDHTVSSFGPSKEFRQDYDMIKLEKQLLGVEPVDIRLADSDPSSLDPVPEIASVSDHTADTASETGTATNTASAGLSDILSLLQNSNSVNNLSNEQLGALFKELMMNLGDKK